MHNLIGLQDEYIETVNSGIDRWAHRRDGGHARRIQRGANRRIRAKLAKLGFSPEEAEYALNQAREMAELIRIAEHGE